MRKQYIFNSKRTLNQKVIGMFIFSLLFSVIGLLKFALYIFNYSDTNDLRSTDSILLFMIPISIILFSNLIKKRGFVIENNNLIVSTFIFGNPFVKLGLI